MKDRYKREMELLEPRQEALDRLYTMLEEGSEMEHKKWMVRRVAAVLVCAVLTITAAAAVVPSVWEALLGRLGAFAPYAQTIEGAVCSDQGIEIQVLGSLSDDLEGRVYLAVRDVDGDRLDQCLTLKGRLETGEQRGPVEGASEPSIGIVGSGSFDLLSYDPDTRTALFSASVFYGDTARPTGDARLSLTEMTTQEGTMYGYASCAAVTGEVLESLPAGEGAKVIYEPSDSFGCTYPDPMLPSPAVVLAPEQTPIPFEGTEDMWISSMGFASDGCFHIRLGFAEGVLPEEGSFLTNLFLLGDTGDWCWTYQQTLVDGGLDVLFPLLHVEDLELIRRCESRSYGLYTRRGTVIQGAWTMEFQMEHHPSLVLDEVGEVAGRQVRQVTVSPLSVTMHSNDPGGFHSAALYAVNRDGSKVAAQPGIGRYWNAGADTGETVWESFNTWSFDRPIDLEEVAALELEGERIEVDGARP